MRTPVFELHIQPMFRSIDRDHMVFALDLWDYDQVVAHADHILSRLEGDMPPKVSGGPWPQEWIDLFRRWKDGARKRLVIGSGQFAFTQTASATTVKATGTFPAPGFEGWLHLEDETDTARKYVLYFEPPDTPEEGAPDPFTIKERYPASDNRAVFVRDATGVHQVH